jgi:hypothetical protein
VMGDLWWVAACITARGWDCCWCSRDLTRAMGQDIEGEQAALIEPKRLR